MLTATGSFADMSVKDSAGRFETLKRDLSFAGVDCAIVSVRDISSGSFVTEDVDILYVTIDGRDSCDAILNSTKPIIAIISRGALAGAEALSGIDDFVIEPWDAAELLARTKRILRSRHPAGSRDLIVRGDLAINVTECEVCVAGKPMELTYREYELLLFLAGNPGRVYSRDALLNKVWGYDYIGGDRTVDVHIRRLRSKIEDESHTFIDTVRNMGYRFRKDL